MDKSRQRDNDRDATPHEIPLGAFRFIPDQSLLLRRGKRVRIGSRALSLLKVLAANAGEFIPNDALMAAAWPNVHVEETNLRVQMTALRRLLGEESDQVVIANAPGRGYALTISPGAPADPNRQSPFPEEPAAGQSLPAQLTSLIGREDSVAAVLDRLSTRRFVAIVGPGGIGKTRVAIEACVRLSAEGRLRICFVDLAPLSSGEFVASAVASALQSDDETRATPTERAIRELHRQPSLLVFDNCDLVVEAAAELSERLLRVLPSLRILVTSREPLLIEGEVTIRLGGLTSPVDRADAINFQDILAFPAVQLFAERATAGADGLSFENSDAPLVGEICQRLDGIPLAIELAAASVPSLGVKEVAALVRDQFATLTAGRRTAPPRQRTMRATMEWSYDRLPRDEKELLVRLSVFRSMFSLAGAQAMNQHQPEAAIQLLNNLVAKSLVVVDQRWAVTRFRLLETTRRFAEEKLRDREDSPDAHRRLAEHIVALFAAEQRGVHADPSMDRREGFRLRVDDVRSAIGWSLSSTGDSRLGIRLISVSGPMWLSLGILGEYVAIVDSAADRLWEDAGIDAKDAIWLAPSLHLAKFNVAGISTSMVPMLSRALQLAEQLGDDRCQLTCLWGLLGARLTEARYAESLELALRVAELAPRLGDPMQRAMSERVVGLLKWRSGDLSGARPHVEIALAPVDPNPGSLLNESLIYKQEVAARASASNLYWLIGLADQAGAQAADAQTIGLEHDVLGLCYGLAQAMVPLAFWTGDLEQAHASTMLLMDLAKDSGLGFWLNWGRSYECALERLSSIHRRGPDFIDTQAASLGGLHLQILATILGDASGLVPDAETPRTHWCAAELLRLAGLARLKDGDTEAGHSFLTNALALSKRQGAYAWELRAATSLANRHIEDGRREVARDLLLPIIERAKEGFDTIDLRRATELAAG